MKTLAEKLDTLRTRIDQAQLAALHAHGDAADQAAHGATNQQPLADALALLRLRLDEASLLLRIALR
jgi:hypothetical protein